MTTISTRLAALGVTALVLTTACGSDNIVSPTFGAACVRGTLSPGQVVQGALSSASCRIPYHFYTDYAMPYETWTVHLTAGQGYMFTERQMPDVAQDSLDNVDAVLTLWGKDENGVSIPFAVSDDDAGGPEGHDSEFWFIAPMSGDYNLVAGSYEWYDFGGYELSMQSCPVLGTLDTTGTYVYQARASNCIRHDHPDFSDTPISYSFLRVNADSFTHLNVSATHTTSAVAVEMGGPGTDTYANIYNETSYDGGSGAISLQGTSGIVTVAIGTANFEAPGYYVVSFDRTILTAPPPGASHSGVFTMKSAFPHAKQKP